MCVRNINYKRKGVCNMKLKRLNIKVCGWLPYQQDDYWLMRNTNYGKWRDINSVPYTKWMKALINVGFNKRFGEPKEWTPQTYRCEIRDDVPSDLTLKLLGK